MGKVQEMVNKLKGKGKAIFLSGLVLFGSSSYVKNVKAEAKEMIPTDYFNGFVFERLPIPTMFDASYEDLQRMIIPNDIGTVKLDDKVIHRDMYILTNSKELTIIKDSQKDQKKNKALLESGKGILLSELESRITKFIINNLTMLGGDPNKIVLHRELLSDIYVSFCENKMGMGDLDFNYLAKYTTYTGDREDVAYSYGATNWKFKELISYLVDERFIDAKEVPYDLFDKEMTLEQFLKDVYLKIIPYYFWPINVKFVKEGIFIPEISEEKRNEKIFDNEEIPGAAVVININNDIVKVILYKYNKEKNEYSDLYTNKKIPLEEVEAWMTVRSGEFQFEEAYHVLGGYGNQVANNNQIFIPFRSSQIKDIIEEPLVSLNFRPYYGLIKNINKNTTIGELVDAYQTTLPLEYTIDYTGFDFSNNPDIVNASESKSPQLVKKPGN